MRTVFYFTITLIFLVSCANTKNEVESIDVLKSYSFEEVEKLMQKEPRQIAIFMHTHWCKYCKNMSQTTLKNKKVVDL
ncbi:thioredoxin family protein, partial [bacterium]|nr:thioredoxin family protein [bacterium]